MSSEKKMCGYDFTWKIMMLGDKASGKSSLTLRFVSGFYLNDLNLTIGVDFYSKMTNYNERKVKLQLWDFGGEERFRFLLHQYCKGANGAFFLYNITIPSTLDHLPDWTQIIREQAGDIPIMLVGTNAHSKELRAVTREQAIQAASMHNLSGFIEVSSKTGQNVEKLFDVMTEILFNRYRSNIMRYNVKHPTFKLDKPITLRLENGNSIKNVCKKIFRQCKHILRKTLEWLADKIREKLDRLK